MYSKNKFRNSIKKQLLFHTLGLDERKCTRELFLVKALNRLWCKRLPHSICSIADGFEINNIFNEQKKPIH